MSRGKKQLPLPTEATIESLAHDGRGVAHVAGKAVFLDGALPGERVRFRYVRTRARHDEGETIEVFEPSPQRVQPFCEHYAVCGGCSLQHMDASAQLRHKQAVLLEQLRNIGDTRPEQLLEPLTGPDRGYRHKARLGARYVVKKDRVLIGFRERRSSLIADIDHCGVLHPAVGRLFPSLKELVGALSVYDRIPQIEVAVGDAEAALTVRHLQAFPPDDLERLRSFERDHGVRLFLQPGGPESARALTPAAGGDDLHYRHESEAVTLRFGPLDFTQVNSAMNRAMLGRIRELLELGPGDALLDLFCGLGNFTLPLARYAGGVTGVEGDATLVDRARANARANGIDNTEFHCVDLGQEDLQASFLRGRYNKLLLDPPRSGAREVLRRLDLTAVNRIVYVSCNPATLARDAGLLVQERGYRMTRAGVMDMFPHTAHIEAIAVFQRH